MRFSTKNIGIAMRMKNNGGEESLMTIRERFHKVDSYDDSSSEYAPLIGWHFFLISVLVCDWLKRRRNQGRRRI